ncbi:urokinase-type plasminogen activator-like [Anopheles albimanus]|uniref:urokinase-type plasminogen activator-like n=1 Tax=Anopheles albimanus TaxID=7167 RepID=UPI00163F6E55|nr:urokinase-type plasminogen activator-like [Anopheles albimanus]
MGTTVWRVEADKTAEHSENSIESSTRNMVARRYAIIIVGIIFALVLFLLQTIQYTAAQHRKQSLDWRCEKGVVEYHRVPPATRIQFMSHLQLSSCQQYCTKWQCYQRHQSTEHRSSTELLLVYMRIKDTVGFHCVHVNRNQSDNVTARVTHHGNGTVRIVKLLDDKGYCYHNFGLNTQPPRLPRSIATLRREQQQQHQQLQRNGQLEPTESWLVNWMGTSEKCSCKNESAAIVTEGSLQSAHAQLASCEYANNKGIVWSRAFSRVQLVRPYEGCLGLHESIPNWDRRSTRFDPRTSSYSGDLNAILRKVDLNKENSTLNSLADWSSVSRSVMSELNANETLPACDILTEFNYHRCTNGSKNSQIVGGQMAEEGDAPFVVSLRNMEHERQHGFGTGLFCGGSLINAHLVLTAAHCLIVEPPNIGVVAGVLNRFDRSARMQFRTVLSYLVPAEWNQPTLFADIGLIALETPFELKGPGSIGSVQPIRLPTSTPQEGTRCMLYGWGKAPEDSGRLYFPIYLQKAEVAVLNLERCNQSISIMLHVPGGTLCAGRYEGLVDSCQGDSGGPLVCGDTPTVVGVVSFGWKCGLPGFPGIYTDVFQYREWLQLSIASDPHTWYKGTAMSRWNAPGITSILVIATLLRQGL